MRQISHPETYDETFDEVNLFLQVAAMKLSPYFRVFEEEANSWEDKLNRILALFDVWIDVQRRWVYLEGIFTGSADIKVPEINRRKDGNNSPSTNQIIWITSLKLVLLVH